MLTETPEFLSKVREAGYDGLVGYDEGVKYIAVMSPGQLKDAYENTGAFSTSNDDIRFRQVYHGSPASFGHFDHAFTGTGEGAQAYGWGTYVTEVEGIARKYAATGIKRENTSPMTGSLYPRCLTTNIILMRYGGYGNARSFLPPMWTV